MQRSSRPRAPLHVVAVQRGATATPVPVRHCSRALPYRRAGPHRPSLTRPHRRRRPSPSPRAPSCSFDHKLYTDDQLECSSQLTNTLTYTQVGGIIAGQLGIGFIADRIGRKWGSVLNAALMLVCEWRRRRAGKGGWWRGGHCT